MRFWEATDQYSCWSLFVLFAFTFVLGSGPLAAEPSKKELLQLLKNREDQALNRTEALGWRYLRNYAAAELSESEDAIRLFSPLADEECKPFVPKKTFFPKPAASGTSQHLRGVGYRMMLFPLEGELIVFAFPAHEVASPTILYYQRLGELKRDYSMTESESVAQEMANMRRIGSARWSLMMTRLYPNTVRRIRVQGPKPTVYQNVDGEVVVKVDASTKNTVDDQLNQYLSQHLGLSPSNEIYRIVRPGASRPPAPVFLASDSDTNTGDSSQKIEVTVATAKVMVGKDVLGTVRRGQQFEVIRTQAGWYLIQFESSKGWLHQSDVRLVP